MISDRSRNCCRTNKIKWTESVTFYCFVSDSFNDVRTWGFVSLKYFTWTVSGSINWVTLKNPLLCSRFKEWRHWHCKKSLSHCPSTYNNIFVPLQLVTALTLSFVLVSKKLGQWHHFPLSPSPSPGLAVRRWSSTLQPDRGWLAEPAETEVQGGARLLRGCPLCGRAGEVSTHCHGD